MLEGQLHESDVIGPSNFFIADDLETSKRKEQYLSLVVDAPLLGVDLCDRIVFCTSYYSKDGAILPSVFVPTETFSCAVSLGCARERWPINDFIEFVDGVMASNSSIQRFINVLVTEGLAYIRQVQEDGGQVFLDAVVIAVPKLFINTCVKRIAQV